MFQTLRKFFNILSIFLIVLGAICWGIWGFFSVDALTAFFGKGGGRVVYCVIGVFGLYGVHLFIEYAKMQIYGPHH